MRQSQLGFFSLKSENLCAYMTTIRKIKEAKKLILSIFLLKSCHEQIKSDLSRLQ